MGALIFLLVVVLLAVPVLLIVALVKLASLRHWVDFLERRITTLEMARDEHAPAASVSVATPEPAPTHIPSHVTATTNLPPPVPEPPSQEPDVPSLPEHNIPAPGQHAREGRATPRTPSALPPPGLIERTLSRAWNWLLTGNVPVKVGMLILLSGVAALLKYASDQGWMRMPVELRLAGISAAALAGLVFAWYKRESHRLFALALQGGAIGVLLLVVFAAVKLYGLIDPGPAFALSVLLIAGGAVLAVVQHSRTLAVLSVLAGFMAPIWLSDGSGNYIALFSWYALFNAGIFAIAWVRPWRSLNLLGFVFTWGIGLGWGVLQYTPDKFAAAQAFLALFFAFYLLLPILYARQQVSAGSARVDGSLLFGTPLVAFSLQAGLLEGEPLPLALCALGVAALYALLGWQLMARERLRRLAQGYAILAVGFATLAVPLAFSANATAAVFALEGAGLVWLGFAQQQRLARWSGLGLQLAAALAWGLGQPGHDDHGVVVIANTVCMGGLLIALAGFAIAWLHRREGKLHWALGAYLWGLAWWIFILGREIFEYGQMYYERHDHSWRLEEPALLLLFGLTGWLASEAHRKQASRGLAWTTCGSLMVALILAPIKGCGLFQAITCGSWAWLLFALLGVRSLYALRANAGTPGRLAQGVWLLLWALVLSVEVWHIHWHHRLADGWLYALTITPWLALLALSFTRWSWLRWPLGEAFDRARTALHIVVLVVFALWWQATLFNAGESAPLPWLVVFNPLDLAQVAVLLLAARWWQQQPWIKGRDAGMGWGVLALAGLVLISVMTLRAVHHWGDVPWGGRLLGTGMAQTSLTVVWSILGVGGWIVGSRRGHWGLWLGSALLMLVVLLKLLLIDRSNLGNLLGIGAFIAYGLMCTLVGWFAPAPPRRAADSEQGHST